MKWSQILHWLSGISGAIAIVMWLFATRSGMQGMMFGNSQMHWFSDAGVFLGIAIWLGITTIIHQNIEKKDK